MSIDSIDFTFQALPGKLYYRVINGPDTFQIGINGVQVIIRQIAIAFPRH